jgi:hypothetical protein
VRRVLRSLEKQRQQTEQGSRNLSDAIKERFARAKGNVVLVQQMLERECGQTVAYSTLTRWVRDGELREPPKRSGEFHWKPGEESQHDTSPHWVTIGSKSVKAQCASLVLAYSRFLYIQYYPNFTRLEAKHFLLEGARFMDGTCPRCVVDNTSVILAGGSGKDAVVAPEMRAFGKALGFEFMAHELDHPDRKGRVERPFHWVEHNFLPGRIFRDFADLNAQALQWCHDTANAKSKRKLGGMRPNEVYVLEKPYLLPLPLALPPVFDVLDRIVDLYGFVSVDTNRYSVPERLVGKPVIVYKYPNELQILYRHQLVATHPRILDRRDARSTLPGHHPPLVRTAREHRPEESFLRASHPLLDRYINEITRRDRTRPLLSRRSLQRLAQFQRTYPAEPFLAAIEQALRFGLFDLGRLEALILRYVSGDFFRLDCSQEDDDDPKDPND